MAGAGFPKGHNRNNMNNFGRVNRSGSHTWGPSSNNHYGQHGQYTPIPAQAVFYHPGIPMKQDFTGYLANPGYGANISVFDAPVSSDSSAQGSPRSFETRHSISSQGFDSAQDENLSTLSSPSDEFGVASNYFADQLSQDRGELPMNHNNAPQFQSAPPIQARDPRASPPQYNRSRQGSTSFPVTQHIVTSEAQRQVQKCTEEIPTSPTNRGRGPKQQRNQRRTGGQQKDYYSIPISNIVDDSPDEDDDLHEVIMETSLNARMQLTICKKVDEILRGCLFWWLVNYKFDIPRNPRARDIETADDRDMDGFCTIINDLTANRRVPREAVEHERIAELNTVLAGPSEIRHMLAHPERHLKSDWRMLGLIAAAIEVCKILQYRKGHRQLFRLYQSTEAQINAIKFEKFKLEAAMAETSISKDDKELKR